MRNLADAIENFIIQEFMRDRDDALLVKRSDLAEKLSCAPSQISYVLSTRFTPERGFIVESRRGSGGFVRIVRVVPKEEVVPEKEPTALELVQHLAQKRMITAREQRLLKFILEIIDADEEQKKSILQQAIGQMTNGQG
ncbi:MAG: CtsR family transcriptional regulator [Phascolarctobacterium sp.]|jgi:transcriptional regulator CtsR|nr:CtsR family transcriptional regulator [Phascolarctobacterium sp.]MBQ5625168.1 CtsR family transcriptional regulator [Phascolarctobacterium sp.]MBQ6618038.1 CtsR family transcriptional regulator [Phascolarctobacterium sp.]MBR5172425.1 CtsR family transcriptional regulator [Phascolarctobacterium sp.]MBR5589733.1 CtsR family transcriptional regulator [Phascolarctobacterium sp.]